ncbi:uncharacterized protein JCM15063_000700 [Sporobolomyces koalae]|uniref:uncharacterized protein n=1 Tax=Sporobolomyces koalae TaxID=500713 RepID=UPI00317F29ED
MEAHAMWTGRGSAAEVQFEPLRPKEPSWPTARREISSAPLPPPGIPIRVPHTLPPRPAGSNLAPTSGNHYPRAQGPPHVPFRQPPARQLSFPEQPPYPVAHYDHPSSLAASPSPSLSTAPSFASSVPTFSTAPSTHAPDPAQSNYHHAHLIPGLPQPGLSHAHSTLHTLAMQNKAAAQWANPPARPPQAPDPNDLVTLSRFAPTYNPLWLRQVNSTVPSMFFPIAPSTELEVYRALIGEVYPPDLLAKLIDAEVGATKRIQQQLSLKPNSFQGEIDSTQIDLYPLSPTTYAAHWIPLHALEYSARQFELYQSTLFNAKLSQHSSQAGHHLFSIPTPFIRESWPPIALGDTCYLRPLLQETKSWRGVEVEARVYAIERIKGEVIVDVEKDAGEWLAACQREAFETKVNVIWRIQDRLFEDWKQAAELTDLHLQQSSLATSALNDSAVANGKSATKTRRKRFPIESWLFPTREDLADQEEGTDVPVLAGRKWVDAKLNAEQKNAVQSILWAGHRAPLLISGPPGTGKTKTLVEAVFQILKDKPNARVLVCGASNPSTDTLALRLRSLMPSQLLRLNHHTRPFNEVKGELLPFCHVEGEAFGIPDVQTLLSKRVICTTVLDCSILLAARLTNRDLSTVEAGLESKLHPERSASTRKPHFDYLLVDEAGQATECDLLPALAAVATDPSICATPAHVTICGDSNQLSPHVVSPTARDYDLDVSLLERLLRLPLYSDHPFARKNRAKHVDATWHIRDTPFVDLVRNYRSVEEILWLPSTLFYHETLVPYAAKTIQESLSRNWSTLPNPHFPILFHHSEGEDFEVEEGSSFYNPSEIALVVELVQDLLRDGIVRGHGGLRAREVSVISPFREQVWRVRLALRKVGLGDVDVGNVEALQGAENRVVIISPVRSINTRWIEHDRQTNRGLIFEPKRFNVAMTRAKELLIVLGNAHTLTLDPYWRAFYHLCVRNQCYRGPPVKTLSGEEDFAASASVVSRMEREYRANARSGRDEGTEMDITVGRMVNLLDEESD